jgi:hypothetical protein
MVSRRLLDDKRGGLNSRVAGVGYVDDWLAVVMKGGRICKSAAKNCLRGFSR